MDKTEAAEILTEYVSQYRDKTYAELMKLIGDVQVHESTGVSGTEYIMEFIIMWDHKPNGDILVSGGIDDGGFRSAFSPLCEDFILTPDGEYAGE